MKLHGVRVHFFKFRRNNSAICIYASPINKDQLLKEGFFAQGSKQADTIWSLFVKMTRNVADIPITVSVSIFCMKFYLVFLIFMKNCSIVFIILNAFLTTRAMLIQV